MGGDSGKPGASEAASLVFRIATMGLSLASAIMTAASTQCVNGGATVSYSDYNSFKYSALADLLSAVLQGVAIYLEIVKKEKAAKVVELIDKLLLALTSTSATLLFAVDDITSCGVGRQRSSSRICAQAGRFCGQIRASSAFSLAAASSVSVSVYARHAPLSITMLKPKAQPPVIEIQPPTPPPVVESNPTRDEEKKKKSNAHAKGFVRRTRENFNAHSAYYRRNQVQRRRRALPLHTNYDGAVAAGDATAVLRMPETDDPPRLREPRSMCTSTISKRSYSASNPTTWNVLFIYVSRKG